MTQTLNTFGFKDFPQFLNSTFRNVMKYETIIYHMSAILVLFQTFIGLPVGAIYAFVVLNCLELLTGIKAAVHEGQRIDSTKMNRFIIKTAVYLFILGVLNVFQALPVPGALALFGWMYWAIFVTISLVLIRSIFENLHVLGVKEAKIIYQLLDNKYTSFLKEIAAPNEKRKNG